MTSNFCKTLAILAVCTIFFPLNVQAATSKDRVEYLKEKALEARAEELVDRHRELKHEEKTRREIREEQARKNRIKERHIRRKSKKQELKKFFEKPRYNQ